MAAEWTTANAQGVSFEVDGQPLSAAAGYPASGSGNMPVPCDNREHIDHHQHLGRRHARSSAA